MVQENFDFRIKPYDGCVIEQKALAVAKVTTEDIQKYPSEQQVYRELTGMLSEYVNKFNKTDKFFMVGYNIKGFDVEFFRAFFERNQDKYFGSWFWSVPLDIIVLAQNKLAAQRPNMENFQLATVAEKLGIHVDQTRLHDAAYDSEIMMLVYDMCRI